MPKIAVISATHISLSPIEQTVAQYFPEVQLVHFMDEAMSLIAKRDGQVSPSNLCRMVNLIKNANEFGVDGVLLSCTIFSPYDELLAEFSESPLVAADVATFEKAVEAYTKIGVVVTFEPTLKSVGAILDRCRERIGPFEADIRLAEGAFDAAARGDDDTHNKIVADCARSLADSCQVIVLSQMSQLRALPLLTELAIPVLTTPAVSLGVLLDKISAQKKTKA
jgi:hypothetical protein